MEVEHGCRFWCTRGMRDEVEMVIRINEKALRLIVPGGFDILDHSMEGKMVNIAVVPKSEDSRWICDIIASWILNLYFPKFNYSKVNNKLCSGGSVYHPSMRNKHGKFARDVESFV